MEFRRTHKNIIFSCVFFNFLPCASLSQFFTFRCYKYCLLGGLNCRDTQPSQQQLPRQFLAASVGAEIFSHAINVLECWWLLARGQAQLTNFGWPLKVGHFYR